MAAYLDPKLVKALREARKAVPDQAEGRVQAVVTLRSRDPSKPRDAADTEKKVRKLIAKTTRQTRQSPKDLVVFPNLQSFAIDAEAEFVTKILADDDIDSASLND